jgi:hypothetical protein
MHTAITFIIAIIIIVFHYWACRRRPKYWYVGGIIPVLWFGLNTILFLNGKIHFYEDWKMLTFPTIIILLMWIEGYQASKKKEINKMKARDI